MDWLRSAYIGGILLIIFVLLFRWNEFKDQQEVLAVNQPAATVSSVDTSNIPSNESSIPETNNNSEDLPSVNNASAASTTTIATSDSLISVSTDTLTIQIDPKGGDIVQAVLPQHKVKLGGEQGFTILDNTNSTLYIAQSGLVGTNGTDTANGRPTFASPDNEYSLGEGEDSLTVSLTTEQNGVSITKQFIFERNSYLITIRYLIDNTTSNLWQANLYGQIKRDDHKPSAAADSGFGVSPYYGAATTTTEDKYKKLNFKDLSKESEEFSIKGGWVAMVQHYFTSAWVPNKEDTNQYFLKKQSNRNIYLLGFVSPSVQVAANSEGEIATQFYVGPKDIDHLEAIAENLDLTIDFGWLWWIAKPIFHLLDFLHSYIGNWGWSIIVLTIIIKAIFFYPSAISYRSMAKMRKVGPKMQQIKELYGDDRQKMSQEMMKLYKKEKVNPMGGCLPILIQMPVFIALYWVLMESVELRHAPFALWINDLSVMDPYFIFPLIMGGTMFIQQKLNPTPPDPMQAKIMQWMPVAFTFMFLWFPVGLVIYWVTNNTLSIIQQYVITRAIEKGSN